MFLGFYFFAYFKVRIFNMRLFITIVLCLTMLHVTSQIAKGNRTLAWQVDLAQNNNYDSAISYAYYGCMESVHLFQSWSSIETDTGVYDPVVIGSFFDVMDIYYPAYGLEVELQIAPINTTSKSVPSSLTNTSFDSPLMINQFKRLLDTMFAHIPNVTLSALNIGNEPDIFWGLNSTKYSEYKTFMDSITPYAKALYFNLHGTDLKIGTTITHHALVAPLTASFAQNLNSTRDIITTTYYPLNNDFAMKNPAVVQADFDSLVSIYNDTTKPIYFAECGYASSSLCNSSEALQAQFYTNVFNAWDSHKDHIKHLTIFKSTDWSTSDVNTLATYYGISDTIFKEYLRTLGVRSYPGNGTNKLAYEQIICELDARSWCSITCNLTDLDEKTVDNLIVYPNPTSNYLNLNKSYEFEVYSMLGKKVLSGTNSSIDVSSLKKGGYLLILDRNMPLRFIKD